MSVSEALKLEEETRQQSSSKTWFSYRAGRITASNMKEVMKTNRAMPSPSLIKRICYQKFLNFQVWVPDMFMKIYLNTEMIFFFN